MEKEIWRPVPIETAELKAEIERLREAIRQWVFLYAWKAEGMNTEQAILHADAFMLAHAALQPEEGEG